MSQLTDKVRELGEKYPDYVYNTSGNEEQSCFYTLPCTGEHTVEYHQGCIMGRALIELYPELKTVLRSIDNNPFIPYIDSLISHLKETTYGIDIVSSEDEIFWLRRVQKNQDKGMSWQDAIKQADEEIQDALV